MIRIPRRRQGLGVLVAAILAMNPGAGFAEEPGTVPIPAGRYLRFFAGRRDVDGKDAGDVRRKPVEIAGFRLDRRPVTNSEFLAFVKKNPKWRRSTVPAVFAESNYLKHWKSDFELASEEEFDRPVTWVSWFTAKAYCESKGMTLPSTDQWEYAAANAGKDRDAIEKEILAWYERPGTAPLPRSGAGRPNGYGVADLFGAVWEWTLDFNETMIGSELRGSGTKDGDLFCGAGALGALDPSNYVTFMRFSFRASLEAAFTVRNLGFRCAGKDAS